MKISAVPAGAGQTSSVSMDEGHSAGAERMARAIAVAAGEAPEPPQSSGDAQVDRAQASIKKIKMRTQRSTPPRQAPTLAEAVAAVEAAPQAESNTLATSEQTQSAEATAPLSPQFAALAREKRALQAMKKELDAAKAAQSTPQTPVQRTKDQITAELLNDLRSGTLSYDDLTQAIMSQSQSLPELAELRAELKAMKDDFSKTQDQRDAAARSQVERQILFDVNQLVATGDEYEAVREAGYQSKVVELIGKVFDAEGRILDTEEAASLIENELIEESLRFARLKKVQGRLTPAQEAQVQQAAKVAAPGTKIMRTLTNRDGVSSASMSRKERAIAAMEGRLK